MKKHKLPTLFRKAQQALEIAVAKTILEHKREGLPLVVWRNGKVVHIPAHKLKVPKVKIPHRKAA